MAIICRVIDRNGLSYLVILRYKPKTSRVETSSLTPIKLLIALKDVRSTKLSLMLRISIVMIEQIYHKRP